MDKLSYALGLGIGRQLSQMGAENLNIDDFAQAIKDMLEGKEPQVADQEAQMIVTEFFQQQEAKQRAAAAEKYKENKDKGEAWLADKALEEGVVSAAQRGQRQEADSSGHRRVPLRGSPHRRHSIRQQLQARRVGYIPVERRYRRLDRGRAAHV